MRATQLTKKCTYLPIDYLQVYTAQLTKQGVDLPIDILCMADLQIYIVYFNVVDL